VGEIALQDFAVKHTLNSARWRIFYKECDVVIANTDRTMKPASILENCAVEEMTSGVGDAERHGMHSHAGAWE
jgi:hypothetical protein